MVDIKANRAATLPAFDKSLRSRSSSPRSSTRTLRTASRKTPDGEDEFGSYRHEDEISCFPALGSAGQEASARACVKGLVSWYWPVVPSMRPMKRSTSGATLESVIIRRLLLRQHREAYEFEPLLGSGGNGPGPRRRPSPSRWLLRPMRQRVCQRRWTAGGTGTPALDENLFVASWGSLVEDA